MESFLAAIAGRRGDDRVVKNTGDGFLAEFSSALAAVRSDAAEDAFSRLVPGLNPVRV
jgi:hypothetical protein